MYGIADSLSVYAGIGKSEKRENVVQEFRLTGKDLEKAIKKAVDIGREADLDRYEFWGDMEDDYEALFRQEGDLYEIGPTISKGEGKLSLKVFVRLSQSALDEEGEYQITGNEDVIFLMLNSTNKARYGRLLVDGMGSDPILVDTFEKDVKPQTYVPKESASIEETTTDALKETEGMSGADIESETLVGDVEQDKPLPDESQSQESEGQDVQEPEASDGSTELTPDESRPQESEGQDVQEPEASDGSTELTPDEPQSQEGEGQDVQESEVSGGSTELTSDDPPASKNEDTAIEVEGGLENGGDAASEQNSPNDNAQRTSIASRSRRTVMLVGSTATSSDAVRNERESDAEQDEDDKNLENFTEIDEWTGDELPGMVYDAVGMNAGSAAAFVALASDLGIGADDKELSVETEEGLKIMVTEKENGALSHVSRMEVMVLGMEDERTRMVLDEAMDEAWGGEVIDACTLDITLYDEEGEETEPAGEVMVRVTGKEDVPDDYDEIKIIHAEECESPREQAERSRGYNVQQDGWSITEIDDVKDELDVDGNINFTTDSFSIYTILFFKNNAEKKRYGFIFQKKVDSKWVSFEPWSESETTQNAINDMINGRMTSLLTEEQNDAVDVVGVLATYGLMEVTDKENGENLAYNNGFFTDDKKNPAKDRTGNPYKVPDDMRIQKGDDGSYPDYWDYNWILLRYEDEKSLTVNGVTVFFGDEKKTGISVPVGDTESIDEYFRKGSPETGISGKYYIFESMYAQINGDDVEVDSIRKIGDVIYGEAVYRNEAGVIIDKVEINIPQTSNGLALTIKLQEAVEINLTVKDDETIEDEKKAGINVHTKYVYDSSESLVPMGADGIFLGKGKYTLYVRKSSGSDRAEVYWRTDQIASGTDEKQVKWFESKTVQVPGHAYKLSGETKLRKHNENETSLKLTLELRKKENLEVIVDGRDKTVAFKADEKWHGVGIFDGSDAGWKSVGSLERLNSLMGNKAEHDCGRAGKLYSYSNDIIDDSNKVNVNSYEAHLVLVQRNIEWNGRLNNLDGLSVNGQPISLIRTPEWVTSHEKNIATTEIHDEEGNVMAKITLSGTHIKGDGDYATIYYIDFVEVKGTLTIDSFNLTKNDKPEMRIGKIDQGLVVTSTNVSDEKFERRENGKLYPAKTSSQEFYDKQIEFRVYPEAGYYISKVYYTYMAGKENFNEQGYEFVLYDADLKETETDTDYGSSWTDGSNNGGRAWWGAQSFKIKVGRDDKKEDFSYSKVVGSSPLNGGKLGDGATKILYFESKPINLEYYMVTDSGTGTVVKSESFDWKRIASLPDLAQFDKRENVEEPEKVTHKAVGYIVGEHAERLGQGEVPSRSLISKGMNEKDAEGKDLNCPIDRKGLKPNGDVISWAKDYLTPSENQGSTAWGPEVKMKKLLIPVRVMYQDMGSVVSTSYQVAVYEERAGESGNYSYNLIARTEELLYYVGEVMSRDIMVLAEISEGEKIQEILDEWRNKGWSVDESKSSQDIVAEEGNNVYKIYLSRAKGIQLHRNGGWPFIGADGADVITPPMRQPALGGTDAELGKGGMEHQELIAGKTGVLQEVERKGAIQRNQKNEELKEAYGQMVYWSVTDFRPEWLSGNGEGYFHLTGMDKAKDRKHLFRCWSYLNEETGEWIRLEKEGMTVNAASSAENGVDIDAWAVPDTEGDIHFRAEWYDDSNENGIPDDLEPRVNIFFKGKKLRGQLEWYNVVSGQRFLDAVVVPETGGEFLYWNPSLPEYVGDGSDVPNGDYIYYPVYKENPPIWDYLREGIDGHWIPVDIEKKKWQFELKNGTKLSNGWYRVGNPYARGDQARYGWFYFRDDDFMNWGWYHVVKDNAWYYLHRISDGSLGLMITGWHYDEADGRWYHLNEQTGIMDTGWTEIDSYLYYFNPEPEEQTWNYDEQTGVWDFNGSKKRPYGSMYQNEETPDGWLVDENGRRIGRAR